MTYLKILSGSEIDSFELPPEFNSHNRKKFFSYPKRIEDIVNDLRTPKNKVGFVLLYGYFKASNKFFAPKKFYQRDIEYVANRLGIAADGIDFKEYKERTLSRHKEIILTELGRKSFDDNKELMAKEAHSLVSKRLKPKAVFLDLITYLNGSKIELPTYHVFASVITEAVKEYEEELVILLNNRLTKKHKELLDDLLTIDDSYNQDEKRDLILKRYKLTLLKKINYSTRPNKIKDNIKDLNVLKVLYSDLSEVINSLSLSSEVIEYYAKWAKKSKIFQIKQKDEEKRYLHLVSFIVHQYYTMQDVLVDILLKSVQSSYNAATQEYKNIYFENRGQQHKLMMSIIKGFKGNIYAVLSQVKSILKNDALSKEDKLNELSKIVFEDEEEQETLMEMVSELEQTSSNVLREKGFYDILKSKSRKLQNRVSNIIKNLTFDIATSDNNIIEAIEDFKSRDGQVNRHSPVSFLEDKEYELIFDDEDKFNVSLYKVLLFIHVMDAIKSGRLNLINSYKYKSLDEYLISKELWNNNREELIKRANLEKYAVFEEVIKELKRLLARGYVITNRNIINGFNEHIKFKSRYDYTLSTPKTEENAGGLADYFPNNKYISLVEVLSVINEHTNFLDTLEHYNLKYNRTRPEDKTFFASIMGLGCNIGTKKLSKISKNISENQVENVTNWYLSVDNINSAIDKILEFISKLELPSIYKQDQEKTHTASDGQKYHIAVESLNANYSYKYFGQRAGVSVNTFIDDRELLFHGNVISSSEREAAYILDGLLHNDVVKSDIHSTDTHGYTDIIFGACHLLGFSFAPRIKNFKGLDLYSFIKRKVYEDRGYRIVPDKYINIKVIQENWDDVLRFIATLALKETTASQLFKRLNSYSKKNPLYTALKEFGRIIKTIFLLKYIDDVNLRQEIQKILNKIEHSNKFSKAVFYGNNQEFQVSTKEEQELAEACKRLIQNAVIGWNYLYLSKKLIQTEDQAKQDEMLNVIKNSSIITWQHINMFGNFDFSKENMQDSMDLDISQILGLNLA